MNINNVLEIIKFMINEKVYDNFVITYNKETEDLNVIFIKSHEPYYKSITSIIINSNGKEIPVYSSREDDIDHIFDISDYISKSINIIIKDLTNQLEQYAHSNDIFNSIKETFQLTDCEYDKLLEFINKLKLDEANIYSDEEEDLIYLLTIELINYPSVRKSFFNNIDNRANEISWIINDNINNIIKNREEKYDCI